MIVTITPNPLLNYVLHLPSFPPDGPRRLPTLPWTVGGKGINVARLLKTLGRPAVAIGFGGGPNGDKIRQRLQDSGITARLIPTSGETRVGIDLVIDHPPAHHWWMENGSDLTPGEVLALVEEAERWRDRAGFVAMSGTLPGNGQTDLYRRLLECLHGSRAEIYLDARGAPLLEALAVGGFFVKHNRQEFSETFQADPFVDPGSNPAFGRLARSRVPGALITDGAGPALLWDPPHFHVLVPPCVRQVSSVGSGDAALAGFIYARTLGHPPLEAARWAMAAGAADACHAGPCEATFDEVATLLPQVATRRLP
ncbi:MAG: hypothetical protein GX442_03215 [Candidatus Riflebacteria bacterium]|nr:hypothetical protein [Candidatus Riflebacteria bacterium]